MTPDGGELVAEMDGEKRFYRSRANPITDSRGREVGRIVYLNDVTDIVEREQRISVLNRALRHNIRNEMKVIGCRLETLKPTTPADREHVETAQHRVNRVIDLSEKARLVEQTLEVGEEYSVVSPKEVIADALATVRDTYPEGRISLDVPENRDVRVVNTPLLELAVRELVEDGVVHHDQPEPSVDVRVTANDDSVAISVTDDGPGIPTEEIAAIEARAETSLTHASGLGLWVVTWFVTLSDGELTFEENQPRGSKVTIRLPRGKTVSQ